MNLPLNPLIAGAEALSPLKRAIVEIRDLRTQLAAARRRQHEPIAVVGMGLRYPGGAVDPESFWQLLWDGVDAITEVPPSRWSADALYDDDPDTPGKMNTRWGGFLDSIDGFDAAFFGISRREAQSMDPQQRLLLEVTWEALENSGIPVESLFGTDTGVFLGISNSDYMRLLLADRDEIDTYTTTGNALSIAAGRLSYVLGANGPAIAVDTACSSSLVAVHLAVQALRRGECTVALAGGVNLILTPELTINFSRARMMAADGRCKTFDAAADGYVRSEGCAMVTLKRLSDAEADGDRIMAVIRGTAVNQDGRSGGLTAPNGPSQERVVMLALADAQLDAEAVSYVEAHGTGTLLGDPIEVGALASALCADRTAERPLLVGSVKTNIGHTEAAAGVAGLIKVVLMLQHGVIAPHLHLDRLNPHIAAGDHAIAVATQRMNWPVEAGRRVAGVSSFGLSGTNAHLIISDAPTVATTVTTAAPPNPARAINVVTVSAKSVAALRGLARRFADQLSADNPTLADVARSANTGRSHLTYRLAVVAADTPGAIRQLEAFMDGQLASTTSDTFVVSGDAALSTDVAFLFTGHGSHYVGMGHGLYADEPVFAAAIDRCEAILDGQIDRRITDVLFADATLLDDMRYAQPALFSLQYALSELWASWGVRPNIVAGHSAGEYVAAVVAGVLSLGDGLSLIAARGRLMHSLPDGGEMVALFVDEATVTAAVVGRHMDVGIAAVNGPTTTVISGRRAAVGAVITELGLDPDEWRRLDISVAAHSPLVEPILDSFGDVVSGVTLSRPQIGLVSSMTGATVDHELTTVEYWQRHLRQPVRFADVFDTLHAMRCSTFVEIGPHPTLLSLGRRHWPDSGSSGVSWVASMRRGSFEPAQMAAGLAAVHVGGVDVDWASFDRHGASPSLSGASSPSRPRMVLPTYPWQREVHWSPVLDRPAAGATNGHAVTPRWNAAVEAAKGQASQGPIDLRVERYPALWMLLDRVTIAAIVEALREMGLFSVAGETHTVQQLLEQGHFAAGYEHLVTRWLQHLVDDGHLVRNGAVFGAVRPLPATDLVSLLSEARAISDGIQPLIDYITRCVGQLAEVVGGNESALTTLFPDGSYETVDFNYGQWALPRYFNAIVGSAVAAVAATRPGQQVRILEVGAGTGGTTAAVLPLLAMNSTSYEFSDVSDFFLTRAAGRFAAYPFVRYVRLDIEQPPTDQGYQLGSYDVIVAANVLHATRHLDVTLAHVRSLLAPGGVLVACEGTEHPRWYDITTGLIEGWQRFEDGWRNDVPLIDEHRWSAALLAAEFSEVASFPAAGSATAVLLHHVVIARSPGDEASSAALVSGRSAGESATDVALGISAAPATARPQADAVAALLAEAMDDERHGVLVDVVRQAIAYVLRIVDATKIKRDQPLMDLGFDSLMAVELRNVLRLCLTLDRRLPATLVFDHPTVNAIATFLGHQLDGSTAAPMRPTSSSPLVESDLESLSDDEAEAMLLRKLAEIE